MQSDEQMGFSVSQREMFFDLSVSLIDNIWLSPVVSKSAMQIKFIIIYY